MNNTVKLQKWKIAQKRHRLSDAQTQMGRELGLNPDKLGKMDNHKQEPWKTPLPQHIENLYYKRFGKELPDCVKPIDRLLKEEKIKKEKSAKKKAEIRKARSDFNDKLELVIEDMQAVFASAACGTGHAMNALDNARTIIKEEKIDKLKYGVTIELSAVLHGIGAIRTQAKHGGVEGELPEPVTAQILNKRGYEQSVIERVCFITENCHAPEKIDRIDFQVVWEAVLIENMRAMDCIETPEALGIFISGNFKTRTGKKIALDRYKA